jgi:hypothetical protein
MGVLSMQLVVIVLCRNLIVIGESPGCKGIGIPRPPEENPNEGYLW